MRNKKGKKMGTNRWLLLLGGLLLICLNANAQQPGEKTQITGNAPAKTTAVATSKEASPPAVNGAFTTSLDDHYKIGPGDVLDIRILNRPNLSRDAVRVEGSGVIRMPLIVLTTCAIALS